MNDARLAEHERVKAKVREHAVDLAGSMAERAHANPDPAARRELLAAVNLELRGFELGWIAARPDDHQAVTAGVEAARRDLRLTHH